MPVFSQKKASIEGSYVMKNRNIMWTPGYLARSQILVL